MNPAVAVAILFAPLALLLTPMAALASPAPVAPAVFARSCSDCSPGCFCEFAYPGASADQVACVSAPTLRHLYRRYSDGFKVCGDVEPCSGQYSQQTTASDLEDCKAKCRLDTNCKLVVFYPPTTCETYMTFSATGAAVGAQVVALDTQSCPTLGTCPN